MLDVNLVGAEETLGVVRRQVRPDHAFFVAALLGAAGYEGGGDLLGGVELQVIEEQRVLAGEEGLAVADGGDGGINPEVVQAVHELVGDDGERAGTEVVIEGEEALLAVAEVVVAGDGAVVVLEHEAKVAKGKPVARLAFQAHLHAGVLEAEEDPDLAQKLD